MRITELLADKMKQMISDFEAVAKENTEKMGCSEEKSRLDVNAQYGFADKICQIANAIALLADSKLY